MREPWTGSAQGTRSRRRAKCQRDESRCSVGSNAAARSICCGSTMQIDLLSLTQGDDRAQDRFFIGAFRPVHVPHAALWSLVCSCWTLRILSLLHTNRYQPQLRGVWPLKAEQGRLWTCPMRSRKADTNPKKRGGKASRCHTCPGRSRWQDVYGATLEALFLIFPGPVSFCRQHYIILQSSGRPYRSSGTLSSHLRWTPLASNSP